MISSRWRTVSALDVTIRPLFGEPAKAAMARSVSAGSRKLTGLTCRRLAVILAVACARLAADVVRSGRTEARTGLRMMPTSPRSPLSFRTAGFPRYGWKAGLSDGAFPIHRPTYACSRHALVGVWFASILRAPRHLSNGTALSRPSGLDCAPPLGVVSTTPGAVARVRVVVSRSVIT